MIKNYLKTAFRNIRKNKVFSLINIAGLAIGISSSLVIFLIVSYDLSFDKFEKNGDRIYRVVSDFVFSGETYHNSGVTYPMGKALQTEELHVLEFGGDLKREGIEETGLGSRDRCLLADEARCGRHGELAHSCR